MEKSAKTYSNRAVAYLELEMFHEAFADATESARLEPSEKAYYRAGRAAYSMRQYSVAAENFRKCLEINEKNARAREDLARSEERMRESSTGVYDMKRIINEVKSGKMRLDVADYVASSVRVADVAGKSKGFVATEKIKRGTLVVASKAASIAYDSECKIKVMSPNFYTKKMDQPAHNHNLSQVFFKLQHDPHLAKRVIIIILLQLKCYMSINIIFIFILRSTSFMLGRTLIALNKCPTESSIRPESSLSSPTTRSSLRTKKTSPTVRHLKAKCKTTAASGSTRATSITRVCPTRNGCTSGTLSCSTLSRTSNRATS